MATDERSDQAETPLLQRLVPGRLTPLQTNMYRALVGSRQVAGSPSIVGPDGALEGPFNVMLAAGSMGSLLQELGAQLRFAGALSAASRETLILMVAQDSDCAFEWDMHVNLARAAGVRDDVIDALRAGHLPPPTTAEEALVFRCWDVISQGGRFTEETFDDLDLLVMPETVVEVTFVVGYYRFLALLISSLGHVDS